MSLSNTLMFDYPTTRALSGYIQESVGALGSASIACQPGPRSTPRCAPSEPQARTDRSEPAYVAFEPAFVADQTPAGVSWPEGRYWRDKAQQLFWFPPTRHVTVGNGKTEAAASGDVWRVGDGRALLG